MQRSSIFLVAILALIPGAPPSIAVAQDDVESCFPASTRTYLSNSVARVFYRPGDPPQMVACAFVRDEPRALDFPSDGQTVFRASVRLARTLVAYGYEVSADDGRLGGSGVAVRDVSQPVADEVISTATAGPLRFAKVTDLVLRSTGGVAWISCAGDPDFNWGSPGRVCRHPGRLNWVYKIDAGARRRTLIGRSRQIDPRSLALRGGRVTWTQGDKRRSARLR